MPTQLVCGTILFHSKVLYDQENWYSLLQNKYRIPTPATLGWNIERQSRYSRKSRLLFQNKSKRPLKRKDILALNDRSSEFFASYFDLLCVERAITPGSEKRMSSYAKKITSFSYKLLKQTFKPTSKISSMGQTTRNTRHLNSTFRTTKESCRTTNHQKEYPSANGLHAKILRNKTDLQCESPCCFFPHRVNWCPTPAKSELWPITLPSHPVANVHGRRRKF